jgi:hypothetical protein
LLCRRSFEQRLQLLAHSSLLGGRELRAAAHQHGHSSKILGRPSKKWWCIDVRVGVCATFGASVVVGLWPACRRRRCTAMRLICSRTALASAAIPVAGLALHRNVLRQASIAVPLTGLALHRHALCKLSLVWLGVHAELLV